MSVVQNQENVFVRVKCLNSDGTPATGMTAATAGHVIHYQRENAAVVTDSTSAADASGLDAAHVDWEFDEIGAGYYQVAYPDAAFVSGAGSVLCWMTATDIDGIANEVAIDHLLKFYGQAEAATATTTTFPAGTNPYQGDMIYVMEGTGAGQTRLIDAVAGDVTTHEGWTVNISDSASTIILIPGDETLGDGGINCDVPVSSRSSHGQADVRSEMDQSNAAGVNATEMAGTTIKGSGVSGDLWRG